MVNKREAAALAPLTRGRRSDARVGATTVVVQRPLRRQLVDGRGLLGWKERRDGFSFGLLGENERGEREMPGGLLGSHGFNGRLESEKGGRLVGDDGFS